MSSYTGVMMVQFLQAVSGVEMDQIERAIKEGIAHANCHLELFMPYFSSGWLRGMQKCSSSMRIVALACFKSLAVCGR